MSDIKSVLWVLDENNKADAVELHLGNATAHVGGDLTVPKHLAIHVEGKTAFECELKQTEEIIEFRLNRNDLQNDEVIEITIEIDCMWCPANINMGTDTRNLGLLIQDVKIYDK